MVPTNPGPTCIMPYSCNIWKHPGLYSTALSIRLEFKIVYNNFN